MLYRLLKVWVWFAMLIFCRKIYINRPSFTASRGPLLLACNHPNSFLDAVILDVLFQKPIWSLARGDVFKSRTIIRFLKLLKILPVYRTSEGVENLSENYKTFESCIEIFRKNGLVQIFCEGKCINEWHLRPLKKGTARLAIKAWEEKIPLQVLPVGINYSSYHRFGKNMFINFGAMINAKDINMDEPDGARNLAFNKILQQQLQELVYEIPATDRETQERLLERKPGLLTKVLLIIPAILGWIIHIPLYAAVKSFAWKRTAYTDHYDSVLNGILIFAYPFYLLLIVFVLWTLTSSWLSLVALFVLPFCAWALTQLKGQLDKPLTHSRVLQLPKLQ